jgi:7-keto-8-aminopelargonate synthetase-like enzyme
VEVIMTHSSSSFAPSHLVQLIEQSVQAAANAGVIMETADDSEYLGTNVAIRGASLRNFGSCSYLALEQRSELKEGAMRAVRRYGTQFPFPRAFLQLPLYNELERTLQSIAGGYPLVAPSTTLGHIAAIPVLVEPGDAVLVDQFAHASVHTAAALIRTAPVELVRHNRVDALERKIAQLAKTHRRVWYLLDGLYSMLGDFAPLPRVAPLLEKFPELHLYIDDAHATSWHGTNGRGYALEQFSDRSRVVVTLSLNKAFAAGGAALVFATEKDRSLVRRCGGPMLFSGSLQPALLGAAVASAKFHLQPEFSDLQRALLDRIRLVLSLADELRVPVASKDPTPIFFVRGGAPAVTFGLAQALRAKGLYVCTSVFPAVPQNQSGIRFTVSLHNTESDIRYLMETLAVEANRAGLDVGASSGPRLAATVG